MSGMKSVLTYIELYLSLPENRSIILSWYLKERLTTSRSFAFSSSPFSSCFERAILICIPKSLHMSMINFWLLVVLWFFIIWLEVKFDCEPCNHRSTFKYQFSMVMLQQKEEKIIDCSDTIWCVFRTQQLQTFKQCSCNFLRSVFFMLRGNSKNISEKNCNFIINHATRETTSKPMKIHAEYFETKQINTHVQNALLNASRSESAIVMTSGKIFENRGVAG